MPPRTRRSERITECHLTMADSIESLTREGQLAAEAFAPLGWAFFGHWPRKESERIRKLLEKGESARVVDEQITEVWNGDLDAMVRVAEYAPCFVVVGTVRVRSAPSVAFAAAFDVASC